MVSRRAVNYFYRFRVGREVSPIGRTKTAPAAGAEVERLRFAVCGCSHYEAGYFTAYRRIAAEQFDFVFHTGDYIYEGRENGGQKPGARTSASGRRDLHPRRLSQSLRPVQDGPRPARGACLGAVHRDVGRSRGRQRLRRRTRRERHAAGGVSAAAGGSLSGVLRNDAAACLDDSQRAEHAHLPPPPVRPVAGFERARHPAVSSKQACNATTATGCQAALEQSRTILGSVQEQWLFEQLGNASATWTVLGQQVPTFARDNQRVAPNGRYSMDKWDGYVASRQRLYARLRETKAPNPIVLSGDVHLHYGADLKVDFENPQSPTVGVEFTNTSITSGADGAEVNATWERIRGDNPHIRYHSARRGYVACTATPQTMRADFKVLERVTVPDSPERTGGSLVVEAGRPGASLA
jgi:alkaline phosphatase D